MGIKQGHIAKIPSMLLLTIDADKRYGVLCLPPFELSITNKLNTTNMTDDERRVQRVEEDASHSGFAQTRKQAFSPGPSIIIKMHSRHCSVIPYIHFPVSLLHLILLNITKNEYFYLFKCEVMFCLGLTKPG